MLSAGENHPVAEAATPLLRKEGSQRASPTYVEQNEHLVFRDGVVAGENVIKLDFTSPILTSGSAITRYVDKEDGSEYIYSLFVPSDASTAYPVFDQPDLKARFTLSISQELDQHKELKPQLDWQFISNTQGEELVVGAALRSGGRSLDFVTEFAETKPISTYVFAFAAGPWEKVSMAGGGGGNLSGSEGAPQSKGPTGTLPTGRVTASVPEGSIYVRKSQAAKFKPHAAEVFRLNREAVRYFEEYFDYKFPFPKYDLVLIPEFPFGGMEHAGATFLRESSIIFPQEPTKNDLVSRATLIFHETAHQWFGDTVTMRWFDDLWLKEGFATFTAYKALEKIMPEMNSWKVFYERIKQGAYQTDSTRGTTAIYQPIPNLSAAKSAYGNIVYNKAPAFLRQAEFYLGEDKFQTAVRAFLKKHEFGNAGWEDLVKEFERTSGQNQQAWAKQWVTVPGVPIVRRSRVEVVNCLDLSLFQKTPIGEPGMWRMNIEPLVRFANGKTWSGTRYRIASTPYGGICDGAPFPKVDFAFPNYRDYGYGIFLLDEKSRDYVLKNIQNERDPFLRSMMWGALWDSVREGELDPREYVELVLKVLSSSKSENHPVAEAATPLLRKEGSSVIDDESTTALLLNRVGTAMNYYIEDSVSSPRVSKGAVGTQAPFLTVGLRTRVEDLLIAGMQNSPTQGQRITYYRAFLSIASSEKGRGVLKGMLSSQLTTPSAEAAATPPSKGGESRGVTIPIRTKDKFDIVTRLLILNDPEAPKLLADLEKTETGDDAKRYAYAAKAGIPTAENKAKYWNDFVNNKEISESWIEAAFGPWNSVRHSELTLPYLQKALQELPNHKRNRKIFFVNGWLGAFIGGQRSEEALAIVNKFLADNPRLDNDLRLKILENADLIERAVKIRGKFGQNRLR
ncbi:MAG: peptidase M1 [Blastocatellia bacterium]|nr:peptidase M1 [Blastocatellia bacterium]